MKGCRDFSLSRYHLSLAREIAFLTVVGDVWRTHFYSSTQLTPSVDIGLVSSAKGYGLTGLEVNPSGMEMTPSELRV